MGAQLSLQDTGPHRDPCAVTLPLGSSRTPGLPRMKTPKPSSLRPREMGLESRQDGRAQQDPSQKEIVNHGEAGYTGSGLLHTLGTETLAAQANMRQEVGAEGWPLWGRLVLSPDLRQVLDAIQADAPMNEEVAMSVSPTPTLRPSRMEEGTRAQSLPREPVLRQQMVTRDLAPAIWRASGVALSLGGG